MLRIGVVSDTHGLLRLEVEAPEAKLPLLRALFAAWVKSGR